MHLLGPLFFVRGGIVLPGYNLGNAGERGYYWSSRAYSNTDYAYEFYFYTSVTLSNSRYRYFGNSLRCLIPTP